MKNGCLKRRFAGKLVLEKIQLLQFVHKSAQSNVLSVPKSGM
jgi:hypothetical protein